MQIDTIDIYLFILLYSYLLPSGKNDVVATLFRRRYRRRYNVENMVTMKVVSTFFVNVFSTSSNDVVSASYIDVETTSKTR